MLVSNSDLFKLNTRYIVPLDTQIRGPDSHLRKMGGFSYRHSVLACNTQRSRYIYIGGLRCELDHARWFMYEGIKLFYKISTKYDQSFIKIFKLLHFISFKEGLYMVGMYIFIVLLHFQPKPFMCMAYWR